MGNNTFTKCISPKENVIGQLEFELAHSDNAVQYFSHYDKFFYLIFTTKDILKFLSFIIHNKRDNILFW